MALSINGITADTPQPPTVPPAIVDAVVGYIEQGMVIVPIVPGEKFRLRLAPGILCEAVTAAEARDLWTKCPTVNVGLKCGKASGIFAIHASTIENPGTRTIRTPTGGHTALFRYPADLDVKSRAQFGALGGADVYAEDRLVILPPSQSKEGEWTWINDEPIAEAPAWLLSLLTR